MNILVVAYYWPPAGGPGVQRWLNLSNELAARGHDITVIVPTNPSYPIIDQELVSQVHGSIKVHKVSTREPLGWAKKLLGKQGSHVQQGSIPKQKDQTLLTKFALWVRGNFFVPDARVGWVTPVVTFVKGHLDPSSFDWLITTGPPHSTHLVGLQLQGGGWKWCADFRDPWTQIGYHKQLKIGRTAQTKHERLEREVLQKANLVLTTTDATTASLNQIAEGRSKIRTLTNGYKAVKPPQKSSSEIFTISHVGSLYADRDPVVLWRALQQLTLGSINAKGNMNNPGSAQGIKLQLVGYVSPEVLASITQHAPNLNVEVVGYVSQEAATRFMYAADLLLLIEAYDVDRAMILPGKVFQYLPTGNPIIAFGPEGSAIEQLLAETAAGKFYTYDTKQVVDLIASSGKETKDRRQKAMQKYAWPALAARLDEMLQ